MRRGAWAQHHRHPDYAGPLYEDVLDDLRTWHRWLACRCPHSRLQRQAHQDDDGMDPLHSALRLYCRRVRPRLFLVYLRAIVQFLDSHSMTDESDLAALKAFNSAEPSA